MLLVLEEVNNSRNWGCAGKHKNVVIVEPFYRLLSYCFSQMKEKLSIKTNA